MRQTDAIRRALHVAASLAILASSRLVAQDGLLIQGVADGELWTTNKTSNLLTRNNGQPAPLGRVQLWGAYQLFRGLVAYGQVHVEGGSASADTAEGHVYSEQFGLRYGTSPAFVIDAGRLAPVLGTFAQRRLSTRNPLIGAPDGYSLSYPYGVEVSGEIAHVDYRAAMVSLPVYHQIYVPRPTHRARPVVGVGVTPITGLRFGASFTAGSYLNDSYSAGQLNGKSWWSYQQRVMSFDVAYAVGYLETHAEYAHGRYDAPRTNAVSGDTYYGEAKYTITPRFFIAGRAERNKYPFIRAFGTNWVARVTDFVNGEAGFGYRVTPNTLLKATVRGDRWWVQPGAAGFLGTGGHAFAIQWSQSFDVLGWFERTPY